MNTENKRKSGLAKLKSAKLLITIWAIILTSYIVFANRTDFLLIAEILCAVPLAYLGVNVWQKKIESDSQGE